MKTYSFVIDEDTVAHVDIYAGYGYAEARSLIYKVYPNNKIRFIPVVMLHRNRFPALDELKIPFIPFGYVNTVQVDDWKEYFYG